MRTGKSRGKPGARNRLRGIGYLLLGLLFAGMAIDFAIAGEIPLRRGNGVIRLDAKPGIYMLNVFATVVVAIWAVRRGWRILSGKAEP